MKANFIYATGDVSVEEVTVPKLQYNNAKEIKTCLTKLTDYQMA
ncbi:hypothetical protein [Paenibacillus agricola]|nr:hypothetical protein [Paenibacillus agricola]